MNRGSQASPLLYLASFILVVVALHYGKPVLMPLALATLLSFLLSPVVNALSRRWFNQTAAVIVVVLFMFSLLGVTVWGVGQQMSTLAFELPEYKDNIREKILDFKSAGKGSALERVQETWKEIKGELKKPGPAATNTAPAEAESEAGEPAPPETILEPDPVPVVVHGPGSGMWQLPSALGPLVGVLATGGLVVVLVIFTLLRKRELRNRFIVLFGRDRMPTTTRALDEAAERISRYLLMQTIINSTFGAAVGIGLYLIGLPYALLWGGLAALLRFIPYVGPWLGAAMPVLLSLAVFPGWLHPLLVLGLILCLELLSNMIMEPMLYGHTVGVSEVGLLVAVAFWTWVWGPIGLVLATPLTVCMVVLGKYVPGLKFIPLMMSDEPVLDPPNLFYQRLLAMDKGEATEIALDYAEKHSLNDLYDHLLLRALVSARRDNNHGTVSESHLEFMVEAVDTIAAEARKTLKALETNGVHVQVLAVPIEDNLDEAALRLLKDLLPLNIKLDLVSSQTLTGEVLEKVRSSSPGLVLLGALNWGGSSEMRLLAKKLVAQFPTLPVVIGRWGLANPLKRKELAGSTGANAVISTLAEARNTLLHLAQLERRINSAAEAPLPLIADHARS